MNKKNIDNIKMLHGMGVKIVKILVCVHCSGMFLQKSGKHVYDYDKSEI